MSDLSRGAVDSGPVALYLELVRMWSAQVPVGLLDDDVSALGSDAELLHGLDQQH